jgi:amino acid transporter
MMAGANISGELRNAQKSLPFGTMVSVVLSNIVYIAIAVILGSTCLRDGGQHGGLFDDSILMIRLAVWPPLVIVGIFASTLSSALATLVGAPRILKAVCDDGLFPPLEYFAKAREKDNEPIRGYFLTGFVAAVGIMIGDLNAIAPLITNFFLATRALINFACFLASYSRSPGWRPSYKMYNKWVSLVTAVLCIAVMFAISWWQALVTLGIGVALYVYIRRAAPEVNWGAAELGYKWSQAKQSLLHLDKVELSHHVKTWRPIFLGVPLDY